MFKKNRNEVVVNKRTISESFSDLTALEHFLFVFYCFLLCVPAYAIVISVINQNWLMVIIDVLLVPIGFVHGLLILFGLA
jgi:hypothetical protein